MLGLLTRTCACLCLSFLALRVSAQLEAPATGPAIELTEALAGPSLETPT